MKYYITALLLGFAISCNNPSKNYRTGSETSDLVKEDTESIEEMPIPPAQEIANGDAGANIPELDPELVSLAEAVKSKLIIDLTNTLDVLKNNSQLQGLDLDIDVSQIGNEVEQIILKQASLAELQNNQQQIKVEIEEVIKNHVKAKMGNNSALVDLVFAEVSEQISSQLIKSFQ